MRREELAHVLRAAARVVDDPDILVIGSQAILGTFSEDELPEIAWLSVEADLAFFDDEDETGITRCAAGGRGSGWGRAQSATALRRPRWFPRVRCVRWRHAHDVHVSTPLV